MFSQLFYDGYQPIAANLASAVMAHPACPPSDRLNHLIALGLQHEHSEYILMNENVQLF